MKGLLDQLGSGGRLTRMRGFTLIELMVVVAVVAILAAIAYPSYQEHVRKTRRAQARVDLVESVQLLERYYSARNTYVGFDDANLRSTQSVFYTIDFSGTPDSTTFILEAEPVAGSAQAADRCGTLSINQAGVKGQKSGMTNAECW